MWERQFKGEFMELADRQYQAVFPEFKEHQEQKAFSLLKSCDRLMNQALQKRNTQRVSSLLKRRERLNDLIVSRNMPLVFYAAKDFPVTGSEWGRILSEASIGLIHCRGFVQHIVYSPNLNSMLCEGYG